MTVRELAAALAAIPESYQGCEVVTDEECTQRYIGSLVLCKADWKDDGTQVIDLGSYAPPGEPGVLYVSAESIERYGPKKPEQPT